MAAAIQRPAWDSVSNVAWFAPPWRLAHRIAFRFVFAYFILYSLPRTNPLTILPLTPRLAFSYSQGSRQAVEWIGTRVFHLTGEAAIYQRTGSGDMTLDYVNNFSVLVISLVIAAIWSILDRQRLEYRRLHGWLRVWVRYSLAFTLFGYGLNKVFPIQFQAPALNRMLEPLGDFSPMGILWTFMGASTAYTVFAGMAEVTGGALLLFRRTTTLGAMVSAAVLTNVVMLNFCYDVPVKLFSANLLLMAIFLIAPDLERLASVLVFNRAVNAVKFEMPRSRALKIAGIALKTGFVGFGLFLQIRGNYQGYLKYIVNAPKSPLYGIWEVESFTRNGQEVAIAGDAARWKRMTFQDPQAVTVRRSDDRDMGLFTQFVPPLDHVRLLAGPQRQQRGELAYFLEPNDRLRLEGTFMDAPLTIKLRRNQNFLLTTRGFHWINERPLNR